MVPLSRPGDSLTLLRYPVDLGNLMRQPGNTIELAAHVCSRAITERPGSRVELSLASSAVRASGLRRTAPRGTPG